MNKFSIVIPCYNEEAGIENLKLKLTPILTEILKSYALELIFIGVIISYPGVPLLFKL